jgi:hypothetical protein
MIHEWVLAGGVKRCGEWRGHDVRLSLGELVKVFGEKLLGWIAGVTSRRTWLLLYSGSDIGARGADHAEDGNAVGRGLRPFSCASSVGRVITGQRSVTCEPTFHLVVSKYPTTNLRGKFHGILGHHMRRVRAPYADTGFPDCYSRPDRMVQRVSGAVHYEHPQIFFRYVVT